MTGRFEANSKEMLYPPKCIYFQVSFLFLHLVAFHYGYCQYKKYDHLFINLMMVSVAETAQL